MQWEMAQARQSFPSVVQAAYHEPQFITEQNEMVAAVIRGPLFYEFLAWYNIQPKPAMIQPVSPETATYNVDAHKPQQTMGEALAELRQICAEENYALDIPARQDRPNAFLEVFGD
ncbi:MAG: hypothetical protein AAF639_29185 [Chloroflexota bacterium]